MSYNALMLRNSSFAALLLGFLVSSVSLFSLFCPTAVIADPASLSSPGGDKKHDAVSIRIMVILAEFPDAAHTVSPDVIRSRVFADVNNYYKENSYGLVSVTGDITKNWIKMSRPIRSYGDFSKFTGSDLQERRFKLVLDIINAADNQVDFKQYDKAIIVIPSVITVNFAMWQPIQTNDGVSIRWVTVQCESASAGVIAHELGHSIGLPDLYNASMAQSGDNPYVFMGPWCLMSDGGGEDLCGFSKIELGWMPAERIADLPAGSKKLISLEPLEAATEGIQIIRIAKNGQAGANNLYYLVEARRKIGFDKVLPDEGILITEVDETKAVKNWHLIIDGPAGFVKLVKPDADLVNLDHATFNLGTGKKNIFIDAGQNLAVIVVNADSRGFAVVVTTVQDADRIAGYALQLYEAKSAIDGLGSAVSPETKALLIQASTEYDGCLANIRSEDPALDTQKLDKIHDLVDQATTSSGRYNEAAAEVDRASQSIEDAAANGRSYGLEAARPLLDQAKKALGSFNYDKAIVAATLARKSAGRACSFAVYFTNTVTAPFRGAAQPETGFETLSVNVSPTKAIAGHDVTVIARIVNTGDIPGVYPAILSIDGNEAARKDLTMAAGSTQTAVLKFTPANEGEHVIKFGDLQINLAVKKIVRKEIQLKYDSGTPRDAISVPGGYAVDFSPPAAPMIIKQINIAATFSPKADKNPVNNSFDLEILDKDLRPFYAATYPYNQFSSSAVAWVTFDIPDVQVNDRFYVIVYSKSPLYALYMGADDSLVNVHSDLATRDVAGNVQIAGQWLLGTGRQTWFADKSKVNWMIRVVGVVEVPED